MKLHPFQELAVAKMLDFLQNGPEHGCYNATEQGLGKTIETIEAISRLKLKPVLIICPAVMLHTWKAEIIKWHPGASILLILSGRGCPSKLEELEHHDYTIISYALAAKKEVCDVLVRMQFTCLVLDEAHYLKTARAARTKAILGRLWPKIPYRICLSGTPATKSIADLYTTFHRLNPTAFTDFRSFTERYTNPRWDGYAVRYEGIKNEKELSKIMRSTFYVRDTKEEVAKDLPSKNWCRITLPNALCISHEETEYEREVHRAYVQQLKTAIIANRPAPVPPRPIATKRKDQALKKVSSVVEFTKDLLEQELPVVVFAHHLEVIAKLKEGLFKYNPGVITGEVAVSFREKTIKDFREGETKLILCNMMAGGIGIDLTTANNAVFAELDYSPAVVSQAAARVHRLTTKLPVNLYYFLVDGSIEEDIFETVIEKANTFSKVI